MPRILSSAISCTKAHQVYSLVLQERGLAIWEFLRTWDGKNFRRVAIGVLDKIESDAIRELSVIGSVVAAVGSSACAVAISVGSHVLAETYAEYLGSGYAERLIEYQIFVLRLLKGCLQKVASSVFGCLDPFLMTKFIINRLKGAEQRDWIISLSTFRRAIITNELQMPSLVDVTNIVSV